MKLFNIKHILTVPSLLNICGIAIAVAAFYVIMSVVDFDLTYNHSIKDYEKVYNLTVGGYDDGKRHNIISRPLGETFGRKCPMVEHYGCLNPWDKWALYIKRNDEYNKLEIRTGKISRGLIPTLDIKILEGDTTKFVNENQVIISRSDAEKFGIHIGEFLKYDLNSRDEVEVVAIYDIAQNTELKPFGGFRCIGDEYINESGWSVTSYYYRMYSPVDKVSIMAVAKDIIRHSFDGYELPQNAKDSLNCTTEEYVENVVNDVISQLSPELVPFDRLHFEPKIDGIHEPADPKIVYTLLILAIVIILIAYINYVNFFFARVPQRIKAINTMKILGSDRTNLVMTLVGESMTYTFISLVLAFVLVHTLVPSLVGGAVDMDMMVYSNHKMLVISVLIPIITSIAVSIYPSLYITDIPPALALKGNVTQTHDFALRYVLIGFQITASTALIIGSLFIHKNIDFINNTNLGFNRDNLLAVETSQRISENRDDVRSLLLQNPDILDITWTHSELIATDRHRVVMPIVKDGVSENVQVDMVFVSDNFFDFMDMEIVEGRGFLPSDYKAENGVYVFNQTARKKYNVTLDHRFCDINDGRLCDIVGFCNDSKLKPLRYAIEPFVFYAPGTKAPNYTNLQHLYIRISDHANIKNTMRHIEQSLAQIDPDFPYIGNPIKTFQNEVLSANYAQETDLTRLITLFAFIAILISVMGIFGVVYFETERRRKEIGIRRVNGATITEILTMFNVKFLKITAICSVIAIPVAFIFVQKYFSGFVFHYAINPWIFILGVLIAVLVTVLVVTAASFKAANENPVKTLKNE